MRKRARRRRVRRLGPGSLGLFLLTALAASAALWFGYRAVRAAPEDETPPPPAPASTARTAVPGPPAGERATVVPAALHGEPAATLSPLPDPPAAPAGGAAVAVVVDDLGRSVDDVATLAALGVPLTYAVLPYERLTSEVVAAVRAAGGELILHLPMEGRDGADPGPGALTLGMGESELAAATRAALAAVPGAVGLNNHMGSVLSADASSMRVVLGELTGRNLYFLDSRTTADSVGYGAARRLGMAAARRDVFLDAELDPRSIRAELRRLLGLAAERGSAIAIGHPHPETLAVLAEEVPLARRLGYRFVPVSALVERGAAFGESTRPRRGALSGTVRSGTEPDELATGGN